ncbi:hypothetical protein IJI64_00400 [Candidatus Saccharibacteria bacterium]|nr:hypothetical protein [Candidatus Saccharibacteria bacterium]
MKKFFRKGLPLTLLAISLIVILVFTALLVTKPSSPSEMGREASESILETEEATTSSNELVVATGSATAATSTEVTEAASAASSEEEVVEETNERQTFEYDEATAKPAYINTTDITQEVFDTFVENLNSNWDFSQRSKEEFIAEHPEIFGDYLKDMDGKLAIPFEGEDQMTAQDEARQNAAKLVGLETQPINDALDFPNAELTEADVKAIKAARTNQKVKLEKDLETYEIAIFKDWLSKPVVFESFINLMLDQKIGSDFTLRENWTGPSKFTEAYDKAREDGEGVNHWLRDFEDEGGNHYAFMTTEYVYDYVIPFISFVYTQPFSCEVLTSREHYHLVAGDDDALRKAELASYRDNKAAFVWRFMLKDNSIALMLGDNVRDGRPEILNYTVIKKPVVKKVDQTPTPTSTSTPSNPTSNPPSNPPSDPPSNPPSNPPSDPPSNPPGGDDDDPTPETKSPNQGSASQGNADVGGGKNDDSGPGEQKADQGNSKSDKVEESQYQQGNSENKTSDKTSYDQGPAADNTDNGTPPSTAPINTQEAINNNDYVQPSSSSSSGSSSSSSSSSGSSSSSSSSGSSSTPASPGTSSDNTTAIAEPPID